MRQYLLKANSVVTYCNAISQIDVVMNNENSILTRYNFPNHKDAWGLEGHTEKIEAFNNSIQFISRIKLKNIKARHSYVTTLNKGRKRTIKNI